MVCLIYSDVGLCWSRLHAHFCCCVLQEICMTDVLSYFFLFIFWPIKCKWWNVKDVDMFVRVEWMLFKRDGLYFWRFVSGDGYELVLCITWAKIKERPLYPCFPVNEQKNIKWRKTYKDIWFNFLSLKHNRRLFAVSCHKAWLPFLKIWWCITWHWSYNESKLWI